MNNQYFGLDITDLYDYSYSYHKVSEALAVAIHTMETELAARRYCIEGNSKKLLTLLEMRRDLPYAIHKTSIKNTYIVLNRNYKPLGSTVRDGYRETVYEDFKSHHIHLTPSQFAELSDLEFSAIFLFGDNNAPWKNRACAEAYLARLKRLCERLNIRITPLKNERVGLS